MNFNDTVSTALRCFAATREQPATSKFRLFLEGPPGCGKSAVARSIGAHGGYDRVIQFFASLRDPVDLLGTPRNGDGLTMWCPPAELAVLRTGRNLLIIEEMTDAATPMQNALCGLIYDGHVGNLQLSEETDIIATGNRVSDRSGAQRLLTKLANRMCRVEFTPDVDQWRAWAMGAGAPVSVVAFIASRPDKLNAFDPAAEQSPTSRTWEYVSRLPQDLPEGEFYEAAQGFIGKGVASEYCAFRRLTDKMPDPKEAITNPKLKLPEEIDILYALTVGVAYHATTENFEQVCAFADRLPKEFGVLCIRDALNRDRPGIAQTKAFAAWVMRNKEILV